MAFDQIINVEYQGKTRLVTKVGFQGFDQSPKLLVFREHRETKRGKEEVIYAEVLYKID